MKEGIEYLSKSSPDLLKKIIRKIPTLVWGLLACSAILTFGFCAGYLKGINSDVPGSPKFTLKEDNTKLKDVVSGYEQLSQLYINQAQDIAVVLDRDMLANHPEEVTDALRSMDQKRDMINVQIGRILELRRTAGLQQYPVQPTSAEGQINFLR